MHRGKGIFLWRKTEKSYFVPREGTKVYFSVKKSTKRKLLFAQRERRSRFSLTKIAGKVIKGRLLALLCKLPRTPSSQPQEVMRGKYVLYIANQKSKVYISSHHQPYRACEHSMPQKASRFDGVGGARRKFSYASHCRLNSSGASMT